MSLSLCYILRATKPSKERGPAGPSIHVKGSNPVISPRTQRDDQTTSEMKTSARDVPGECWRRRAALSTECMARLVR